MFVHEKTTNATRAYFKGYSNCCIQDAALKRYILSYAWIATFLSANLACVFYVFRDQALWNL